MIINSIKFKNFIILQYKDNNMKNILSISIFFVLGFLLAILSSQSIYFIDKDKVNNNAYAETSTTGITSINTFHAKGMIGSLVSHLISDDIIRSLGVANSTNLVNNTYLSQSATHNALSGNISPKMYLADGVWYLDIVNGKVKDLFANFNQVTTTGTNPHTHTITNYRQGNISIPIEVDSKNNIIKINGYADILRNGQPVKNWLNVPIKITLLKDNVISIDIDPIKTSYHFGGTPIFGIITSLTNQNNNDFRQSTLSPNNATNTL
jgi:hypothetical protein